MTAISRNGFNFALGLLAIILLLFNVADAAETTTTTTTNDQTTVTTNLETSPSTTVQSTEYPERIPFSCQDALPKQNVNLTLLRGMWFEAAHKTSSADKRSCIALNLLNETNPITIISTYNTNPNKLSANESSPAFEINLIEGVYRFNFSNGTAQVFKILDTDYDEYALVCSYLNTTQSTDTTTEVPSTTPSTPTDAKSTTMTNESNDSVPSPAPSSTASPETTLSAEAYIFIRHRSKNNSFVNYLITNVAENKYSDFKDLTIVNQSEKCSGAATFLPMLTMIMAVVLAAVVKF